MINQHIDPDLRRAGRLITEACRCLAVSPEALRGPCRERDLVEARHLVCHLLHRAGYSVSAIGLQVCRNHSTVNHALQRVDTTPALAERARELLEVVLPFVEAEGRPSPTRSQTIARVLMRALFGLALLSEVRAVRGYVLSTLLACEQVDPILAAGGLLVVAERPRVRAAVEGALATCGLSAYVGLIPLHLRQMGRG